MTKDQVLKIASDIFEDMSEEPESIIIILSSGTELSHHFEGHDTLLIASIEKTKFSILTDAEVSHGPTTH